MVAYAVSRLGHTYDLKNMIDLARYLLPMPPLPSRWRRRMLALGSGDPTKSICSTLIAQAFQSVGLPDPARARRRASDPGAEEHNREILTIRHYSLYTPRDFDISPYFEVVKPTIEHGFDYRGVTARAAGSAYAGSHGASAQLAPKRTFRQRRHACVRRLSRRQVGRPGPSKGSICDSITPCVPLACNDPAASARASLEVDFVPPECSCCGLKR